MKVYASVWFATKNTSPSQSGVLYLFKTIELSRMLIPDVRNIAYPVIQRRSNAFFVHPENLLNFASDIRKLGWRQIIKAREQSKGKTIRTF